MKGLLRKIPKVALFLATNEKVGRDKLQGILRYVRLHTPWNIHLVENRIGEQKMGDLRAWGAAGIIVARMPDSVHTVALADLPTVVLDSSALYLGHLPRASYVTCDSDAVGRAGADFFLRQGFCHFAYVADTEKWDWSLIRYKAFEKRITETGFTCAVYNGSDVGRKSDWTRDQQRLAEWLLALPKPCAVLAARDGRARQVLETCVLVGLDVPGDVAVLGVDNDEILCENSSPTLSSIQPDSEEAGYQAADLLERLMRRNLRTKQTIFYGVRRIVVRESSRLARVVDRRLLRGLEFIRLNSGEDIGVANVALHMAVSRRMAELLFRKHLGHSILEEIQQVRLTRLKNFLLETPLPIGQISVQCGYQTEMHAKRVFKQATGMTMRQYRRAGAQNQRASTPVDLCTPTTSH